MLGGLRLELARRREVGHQSEVDEHGVFTPHVLAELANRLQEREALDVAHRPADLGDHNVVVGGEPAHRELDLVGDVRDHLNGGAQVVAPFAPC